MVRALSPAEEDARRLTRERETLVVERVRHVNGLEGLLATQGVFVFEPIRSRQALETLRRWDGQVLPPRQKATLLRELESSGTGHVAACGAGSRARSSAVN